MYVMFVDNSIFIIVDGYTTMQGSSWALILMILYNFVKCK